MYLLKMEVFISKKTAKDFKEQLIHEKCYKGIDFSKKG